MSDRTATAPARFVPPLDIARSTARQVLTEAAYLDVGLATHGDLIAHIGHLEAALHMLVDALDEEAGR